MKKRKIYSMLGFVLIMVLLVSACSKKEDKSYNSTESAAPDMDYGTGTNSDVSFDDFAVEYEKPKDANGGEVSEEEAGIGNSSSLNSNTSEAQSQDKIIRRFFMDVETQEFDSLITKIDEEINRLEGYIESSEISGKRFDYSNEARHGRIIVRIPSDKVNDFVNEVKESSNVVNKQESSENVTLQYIDMESRKETLKIEQERLFAILEKEISLDNIIILESRLSDIRYELQNYESQLRYYDNLVAYSTVTLNIQEVERITQVVEEKQTVGDRINNGFSDTIYDLSEGFKNFFVWFVVNLPYLLIWAVIITVIVVIVRKSMKKSKSEKTIPQPLPYTGSLGQNWQSQNPPTQNQMSQNQPNQNQSSKEQNNKDNE